MRIIRAYHKLFCFKSPISVDELQRKLNLGNRMEGVWVKDPGLFNIFDSRGKIVFQLSEQESGSRLKLRMIPYLFRHKGAAIFILASIVIWGILAWLLPLSILFAVIAVFYWLWSSFVAIYVLLAIMLSSSVFLLSTATPVSTGYMVASWIITLLLVHCILAFNQRGLKNYMMSKLQDIEKELCN